MLDLAPYVARLRSRLTRMKDVDFAFNQSLSVDDIKRFPSIYVVQKDVTGSPPYIATQTYLQRVTESFDTVMFIDATGVGTASSKREEALRDVAKVYTDELELALIGWTPSPYVTPLRFVSAKLLDLSQRRMSYRHTFTTDFEFRKTTAD